MKKPVPIKLTDVKGKLQKVVKARHQVYDFKPSKMVQTKKSLDNLARGLHQLFQKTINYKV